MTAALTTILARTLTYALTIVKPCVLMIGMDLATILTDSAAQIDRAKPADERLNTEDWTSPGEAWFALFMETVEAQVQAALDDDGAECPCCGIPT